MNYNPIEKYTKTYRFMKKIKISVASLLIGGAAFIFSSCIGSFALTNQVMKWNKNVGSKAVNELVFVAFWILPVYEVTALADLLVLNSIEFWSGDNPVAANTQVIDTDHGRYFVACDDTGYTITHEPTGRETRLNFSVQEQTWSVEINGEDHPFMTFIDDSHVKMITPEGDFRIMELTEQGTLAFCQAAE